MDILLKNMEYFCEKWNNWAYDPGQGALCMHNGKLCTKLEEIWNI